jgi:hypothetical protein
MSWTPRESAFIAGGVGVWTYDSPAYSRGTFSNNFAPAYNPASLRCIGAIILALKPSAHSVPAFVQGAAPTPANTSVSTFSGTFPNPVTTGNCLVIAIWFNDGISETVSDSLGNTYTLVVGRETPDFTVSRIAVYVCPNCAGGSCDVTYTPNNPVSNAAIAIHEYSGVASLSPVDVSAAATVSLFAWGAADASITTTGSNELLFAVTGEHLYYPPVPPPAGGNPLAPPFLTPSWLIINEPSTGFTDRTNYLYRGEKNNHGWSMELRQRGQATVPLWIPAGDTYAPTRGTPIYLFDQTLVGGYTLAFAGLIQDIQYKWSGTAGNRICTFTAVSLESVFDTVYADGTDQFVDQTCGAIVSALCTKYEHGCPVSLGTISAGVAVPLFVPQKGQRLSELFNQLASTSAFTWGVNPQTQQLYFAEPSVIPAPFTVGNANVLWDSFNWKVNGADYRNRQGIKLSDTAFPQSGEFFAGTGQQSFTLMRPVKQVVSAYVTLSSPSYATGTFSGQPSPSDTVTIGPADTGFSPGTYLLGTVIVVDGYVQQCTFAGTAATTPVFSTVTGGTSTGTVAIFTCLGPYGVGAGVQASSTYTFVAALDNTQPFEVLIGATLAETVQNLVDAINAAAPYGGPPATKGKGLTISLPTWEGAQVNATYISGTQIKVTNKQAASVGVSDLTTTSSAFSWSSAHTTGGNFPQGSVGPNEPATISISVYAVGTSTAAPGLAYQEGSAEISLATPLNSGTNLNVWYTRADGGSIEVENTALVTALAGITHGTGKFQQFTDQSSQGLVSTSALAGLQFAQQILEAYSATPTSFDFKTYSPGLFPGMSLVVSLTLPTGGTAILNGTWVIQSVEAELIPAKPFFGKWGHYRYTIKCVDIQEIASYLDFWEGLGGGSSAGSGGSGALVATSGGALSTAGPTLQLQTNGTANGSQALLNLVPGAHIAITDNGSGDITVTGTTPLSTKGDVYVYGTSATRLPVGSDGRVLTSDSTANNGVSWQPPSAGTVTHAGGPLTSGLPVFGNGTNDIEAGTKRGNTTVAQMADVTTNPATGNVAMFDGNGNIKDAGVFPTQTATSVSHEFLTAYNATTGTFTLAQPTEADLSLSNITTNDVSITKHGFAPKAPNDATKYLDGTGNYSAPPVAAVPGGAASKTASYAAIAGDNSKILSFNSASPTTLTLRSPPPSATWNIEVQNIGSGVLTVSPNGLTLDGSSASVTLSQTQGLYVSTDGSNYFTERGLGTVSQLTTLGDILAFSTVPARQGVGANGTCLQADSTQSTGIKWALQPYDVTFAYPGAPPNATVLQLICFRLAVAMSGNFAGSTGHCGGNPTSTAVYTVYKNASPIGTVTIATSGGFTFATTSGAAQSFVAGDTLSILTPAADATLSSVTMTFAGTR